MPIYYIHLYDGILVRKSLLKLNIVWIKMRMLTDVRVHVIKQISTATLLVQTIRKVGYQAEINIIT